MINFVCPVCKSALEEEEKIYACENGHCFDKSKFGYVNLLLSQKSSAKRHGDDRLMVRARRDFLGAGYYDFLLEALEEILKRYLAHNAEILDAGCGECYYSSSISEKFDFGFVGADISKDALEFASKRKTKFKTAVASVFDLPFPSNSFDCVLNIFSPEADGEFHRVLKGGGILIRVAPLEKHLFDLKAAIYDKPYLNDVANKEIDGFKLLESKKIRKTINLKSGTDIQNLFKMTPYYYKTGKEDQQKISRFETFETQAEFEIAIYGKEGSNA